MAKKNWEENGWKSWKRNFGPIQVFVYGDTNYKTDTVTFKVFCMDVEICAITNNSLHMAYYDDKLETAMLNAAEKAVKKAVKEWMKK